MAAEALPRHPEDAVDFSSDCVEGSSLGVALNPNVELQHGQGGAWAFAAPEGTTIVGAEGEFSADVDFPYLLGSIHSAGVRSHFDPGDDAHRNGCVFVVWDCHFEGGLADIFPVTRVELSVSCDDIKPGCLPENGLVETRAATTSLALEIDDPHSPSFTSLGGTLPLSNGPVGERTVAVDVSDVGGGVASLSLSVDGGEPQTAAPEDGCETPYTVAVPCPPSWQHIFTVDTTGLALGGHSLVLTAVDAAGNSSQFGPVVFTVADEIDPPPPTPPTSGETVPGPQFGASGVAAVIAFDKRVIDVKRSGNVHVTGRVTSAAGAPLAGVSLSASTIDVADIDAGPSVLPSVTTGADGSFDVPVAALGAKRLTLSYMPSGGAASSAASMLIRQSLSLSIKRSRGHLPTRGRLIISGQLGGAGGAHKGAPIEIDALVKGRWRAVAVVKANSRGKYSWRYRFTRVTQPTNFRFRAVVRKTSAWPWPSEFSSTVKVVVG